MDGSHNRIVDQMISETRACSSMIPLLCFINMKKMVSLLQNLIKK